MKKTVRPVDWAPETIYLTRDGWNDCSPEDSEILWSSDRITNGDIEYRRVTPLKKGRRK